MTHVIVMLTRWINMINIYVNNSITQPSTPRPLSSITKSDSWKVTEMIRFTTPQSYIKYPNAPYSVHMF